MPSVTTQLYILIKPGLFPSPLFLLRRSLFSASKISLSRLVTLFFGLNLHSPKSFIPMGHIEHGSQIDSSVHDQNTVGISVMAPIRFEWIDQNRQGQSRRHQGNQKYDPPFFAFHPQKIHGVLELHNTVQDHTKS